MQGRLAMLTFILRRLAVAIPTLLVLIVISFVLMFAAPGGPFNTEKPLPAAVLANIEARYGLDQPYVVQIFNYVWNIVAALRLRALVQVPRPDRLGPDRRGLPGDAHLRRLGLRRSRSCSGVGLGVAAAIRHNTWLDYLAVGSAIGASVLPNFVLAPILVLVFTLWLGWLPAGGWYGGQWQYVVLPVVALATSYLAAIARITRSSMLEVMNAGFIRTARAKGLPMSRIIWRHAMKPTLLPVLSYLGPAFVGMITGSVVIDVFFSTGGHRQVLRELGAEPRLLGDHGRDDPRGGADHRLQPPRRHPLRLDRPQDPLLREGRAMTIASRAAAAGGSSAARRGRRPAARSGPTPAAASCATAPPWRASSCSSLIARLRLLRAACSPGTTARPSTSR